MDTFSVRDVERVLRLSRSTVQGLIKVGFVKPTRGPRREYRFTFQDMIVLRAARALQQASGSGLGAALFTRCARSRFRPHAPV